MADEWPRRPGLSAFWSAAGDTNVDPDAQLAALAARLELAEASASGAGPPLPPSLVPAQLPPSLYAPDGLSGYGVSLYSAFPGAYGLTGPGYAGVPPPPPPPRGRRPQQAPLAPAAEVNYNKIITKKLASATQFHQVRERGWWWARLVVAKTEESCWVRSARPPPDPICCSPPLLPHQRRHHTILCALLNH